MGKAVANEEVAKKLQDRQKLKAEQHAADIAWLLADVRGRRLYWRWLERTHIFKTSFTGNSETFFREGERNIGLILLEDLNVHAPEQYAVMSGEAAADAKLDRDVKQTLEKEFEHAE